MKFIKKIKNKIKERGIIYIVLTLIYKFIKVFYCRLLHFTKINKKIIVFTSKPDFSDNSKYLYEYIRKNDKNSNYKYVWLVSKDWEKSKNQNHNTVYVKLDSKYHADRSLRALYYISKAKLLFFTHQSPMKEIKKKQGQIIINLWHGCGYKSSEIKDYKWIDKNPMDYALVPGKIFIETKTQFWNCQKNQILPIGYPRYNCFLENNEQTKKKIEKICNDNKLIIWMPTFRKTERGIFPEEKNIQNYDLPILSSDKEMSELNKICSQTKIVLCVKRHPFQLRYKCENNKFSNIIFIDNNTLLKEDIDLYSLLKYTDGLITDYSSVAIDYLLLNKPIAFTLDDFEEYSKARGFVFKDPKKYMPGHHIYNFKDMKEYIEDVGKNKDLYKKDRQNIMNEVHNPCDDYCERIIKKIKELKEEF